ncbi:hypothetical protein [Pinibacter aurantiacus]|uniref:Nuclear transport factor 2 family protein n=1 Tax=Pinibacter aurantiacus TaxID=2851599 RepID=A0A9E2S661_9BACT|nr:hypothetical protein [Pinibacter aurantiacus]MBV4355948.1 hypothetical protein [Pinibacter aurantiacus]
MKKLTFFFLTALACSCNNMQTPPKEPVKDTAATAATATPVNYAYTIEHPDYWEIGNPANTATSLSALKAWEDGKLDESLSYFGDSVRVQFDGLDKKMSHDSLTALLTRARNNYKTIKVKMYDWESVISKDKSEEWVTLWYFQTWETPKGVKDSADVINDLQLKNGKIVRLSEYTRKIH